MDHALLESLFNQLEDEDATAVGKKGLSVLDGGKEGPADPDGSNADTTQRPLPNDSRPKTDGDDKLAQLVATLSPEEKAKLRALLDEGEPTPKGV